MERTWVSQLPSLIGEDVILEGWVHKIRELGGINFVILRDRTGMVQAVFKKTETVSSLKNEMVIRIRGRVVSEERAPGGIEVHADEPITIVGNVYYGPYLPLEINNQRAFDKTDLNSILEYRPLSLRNPKIQAIFKIQSELIWSFREFLRNQSFIEIFTPKIVASGTEGGAELFKVDYFEKVAYLAQSPQFYKQIMVGVFERVFEIGHVYRAEKHDTSRHLNEYVSLDYEMGFIESEQDVINLEIELLKHMFSHIEEVCSRELEIWEAHVPVFDTIPQIRLEDAQRLLTEKYGKTSNIKGDLDPESEQLICQYFKEHMGTELVYITHYPVSKRPMYTMPDPDNPELSRSFDLLYRGLEITTGSQRIHDYAMLVDNIRSVGLEPKDFEFYLQVFRYGMPPHGGLAIGIERLTKQLLDLPNIRMTALFPRDRTRITP
ncbi:MAG TPA: aspartate--tRNA(Asn) ligase [Candidatus Latescibacteria bacterium]|nr:aspartate--tRNA(Asn) ligase [Candidatus Latescibacterota bacterium]